MLETCVEEEYKVVVQMSQRPTEAETEELPSNLVTKKPSLWERICFKLNSYLLNPGRARKLIHEGLIALDLFNYKEVVTCLTAARKLYKKYTKNESFYIARGTAREKTKDFKGAYRDFTRAVRLTRSASAYGSRGSLRMKCRKWYDAIEDFNHVLDKEDNPSYYQLRGICYEKMGIMHAALDDYGKALELHPGHKHLRLKRGQLALTYRRYNTALDDFTKLLQHLPNHPDLHHKRGLALFGLQSYEEAAEEFNWILGHDPYNKQARYNRGLTFLRLGKCVQAIADFQFLRKDLYAHYCIGHALEKKEKPCAEAAIQDYRHAYNQYTLVEKHAHGRLQRAATKRKKLCKQMITFLYQVFM